MWNCAFSFWIFGHLSITSCSCEKRYQALPAFLYYKWRKAGGHKHTQKIELYVSHWQVEFLLPLILYLLYTYRQKVFGMPLPTHQIQLECIHGMLTLRASLYIARSIPPVFSRMRVQVAFLTVTTTCDFERGGAMKPIIWSSWNNSVKNCLDLYQVQKRPSMIVLIVFRWRL